MKLKEGKNTIGIIEFVPLFLGVGFGLAFLYKDEEDFWGWFKHPVRSFQNYMYMRERTADWRNEYLKSVESFNSMLEIQKLLKDIVSDVRHLDKILSDIRDYASSNSEFGVTGIGKYVYRSYSLDDERSYSCHFSHGVDGVKVSSRAYEGLGEYVVEYSLFLSKIKDYFSRDSDKVLQEFKFEPSFCAVYIGILGMKAADKVHEEEMRKVRYYEEQEKAKEKEDALSAKKRRRFDLSDL